MTEANTVSQRVHAVHTALKEPEWVLSIREAAWGQYESMPEPRLEKTDLRKRAFTVGDFEAAAATIPADVKTYVEALPHSYALFSNGHLVDLKKSPALQASGVVFENLHTAFETYEKDVKDYFAKVVTADESKWAALNAALFAGGVFVHAPRNVQFDEVIEVVHVTSSTAGSSYPRNLIVAEELASVRVIETAFQAEDQGKHTNSCVTEVVAKPASQVHVATADEFRKGPTNFVTRRARVEKDANVAWTVADVSDGFAVGLIESVMEGTGARAQARVVGIGFGRSHTDLTVNMKHVGRNTESDIVMHGALRNRANSIFRSKTEIVRGAVGAGSEQHDRMIMIDGTARADAIPMLLIDENDVQRCGHAASVGKIDPTQVYYLMSRGIPQAQAVQMIIWGYLRNSVEAFPADHVRDLVVSRIERELAR